MKLHDYLEKYGTPTSLLARRTGISGSALHMIVNGSIPSLKSALRIEIATRGEVTCEDMIDPELIKLPLSKKKEKKRANRNYEQNKPQDITN